MEKTLLTESFFSLDVSIAILAGLVTFIGILSPFNRIRIFCLYEKNIFVFPVVIILTILFSNVLPYIPGTSFLFLGYPIFYNIITIVILLYYSHFLYLRFKRKVQYSRNKKGQMYLFLISCMENHDIKYSEYSSCLKEAIEDIVLDSIKQDDSTGLPKEAKTITHYLNTFCFHRIDSDQPLRNQYLQAAFKAYSVAPNVRHLLVTRIIRTSIEDKNSAMFAELKSMKIDDTCIFAQMFNSKKALQFHSPCIVTENKDKLFSLENLEAYEKISLYFIKKGLPDTLFFNPFCRWNDLHFTLEKFNSLAEDVLCKDESFTNSFYENILLDLAYRRYSLNSKDLDDIIRCLFTYIDILSNRYKKEEDLSFQMHCRPIWLALFENYLYYPDTRIILERIKDEIANISVYNIHLMRFFLVNSSWSENKPGVICRYASEWLIWDSFRHSYSHFYQRQPDLAEKYLPFWISFNSIKKVLEYKHLTSGIVYDSVQCF